MKSSVFILLLLMFFSTLSSQVITKSRTNSGYVNITKDPPKPPYLEIVKGSLTFVDPDGNLMINANENAKIIFQLKNSGQGPGLNLEAKINENNAVPGLNFPQSKIIGILQPSYSVTVEIPVSGNMNTKDTKASFSIAINEANGFGTDPINVEVPVRAFVSPMVKIVDYKITSQSGITIEKQRPFQVQILVQNIGQGKADNVAVTLPMPENMFCLSNNSSIILNSLLPNEQKLIEYTLITNNNFTSNDIKLDFQLNEFFNKYSENKSILITMNQKVSSEKLVVQGKPDQSIDIKEGRLTSYVDKNIPINQKKNPQRVALIIGNEDYSGNLNAEVNVVYAINDATIFRGYAISTLGVPENNIFFSVNATAGEMRKNIDLVAMLLKRMGPQSELIFYYAGHGLPEEDTRIPYLIPVDVDATNLSAAIKLSDVYTKFGDSGAKRVTIFLDACFSGGGRNQGLLAARGVKIPPRAELIVGNIIVFSASSGEQAALPLDSEKHGLFTFFLLKYLQETAGDITYADLADLIRKNVSVESLRVNRKAQDPVVNVSTTLGERWKAWKIIE